MKTLEMKVHRLAECSRLGGMSGGHLAQIEVKERHTEEVDQ